MAAVMRFGMWLSTLTCALAAHAEPAPPFNADQEDVLASRPALKAALCAWWGEAYNETNRWMQLDLLMAGYKGSGKQRDAIGDALQLVVDRRAAHEPCSELPVALARHAWRYDPAELGACLSLVAGARCALGCRLLDVRTELSCSPAGLSGDPPEGECRYERDAAVVRTTGGEVRGLVRPVPWRRAGRESVERTRAFWGVPYAAPPGRFQAARQLSRSSWPGVLDTGDSYGPHAHVKTRCAGLAPVDRNEGSEDCLYLDLYTPAVTGRPLPVVVYLYGAGFSGGDAWLDGHYDGARFTVRNGVILVVVSYRVGYLGHWAHPALAVESGDGSVGNYGELDQRVALQWLQANARAFGGDPTRVTIAGHSSGAFDVNFHLLSPASKGLFSGAILESATFDSGWYFQDKEDVFTFYAELGEALGCPRDPAGSTSSPQVACVRALPLEAFYNFSSWQILQLQTRLLSGPKWELIWDAMKAALSRVGFNRPIQKVGLLEGDNFITTTPMWPILPVGIVVDGSQGGLPAPPKELYQAGRVNDAQVWLNHEANEGTIFAGVLLLAYPWYKRLELSHAAVDAIFEWAIPGFEAMRQFYPQHGDTAWPFSRLSKPIGDGVFVCSARRAARALALRRNGSVFYGELTYKGSQLREQHLLPAILHRDPLYFLGAHHCEQPRWIFGPNGAFSTWDDNDERMMEAVNCHYARMAHCGDPGTPTPQCLQQMGALPSCDLGELPFPAYDPASGQRLQIHPTAGGLTVPPPEEDRRCAYWDTAPPIVLSRSNCRGCAAGRPSLVVV